MRLSEIEVDRKYIGSVVRYIGASDSQGIIMDVTASRWNDKSEWIVAWLSDPNGRHRINRYITGTNCEIVHLAGG